VLYKPEAFEPLTDVSWDGDKVRGRVREIVADTEAAFDPDRLWPPHEEDAPDLGRPLTTLYAGASGVIWALHRLDPQAMTSIDLGSASDRSLELWREKPDFPERAEPPVRSHASLFFGETGPLLVAFLLHSEDKLDLEDLYVRVRENVEAPANEMMWASVGTMLVAKAMLDRTGDERWAEAWRDSAEVLLQRRDEEWLWTSMPFGRGLGAAHGASTTAKVLLDGGDMLDADRREEIAQTTSDALVRHAVRENGLVNWPLVTGDDLVTDDGQIRMQWCHGAAGVVASAAPYLEEEVLLAGAELCWQAGPPILEKGPGLCHGTAGTGYAFLKVFERTGDERWLDRARRFAVHALEQVERAERRHSLFTGGIGAALFAQDCLEVRPQFPIVDVL
jgi:Lanthionine synthetase C-like protein